MTAEARFSGITQKEYQRRIWAWTMYDWANSAFATTILAVVFPIYFSQVAGANLPSATVATTYWSTGLSISLLIIALLSPILGTVSDIMRGKKRFLAIFAGIGILTTALLILVDTGDWMLAAILGILGRIGFAGANTFYDALLPHVAKEADQDRVSTRGYALGYLGGGLLLAINVVMIQLLPGTWGARLSFFSVAIWWAVFSIPLFRRVPEPPAASVKLRPGQNPFLLSFGRLRETFRDIRKYKELFKFLIAFLIYMDGIGTIIGVAAIYGAELGFGDIELILALLLVQFVGIPFSLIFGRLPSSSDKRRPFYLAFILFNLVSLPLVGIAGRYVLPDTITGAPPPKFEQTATAVGEGTYLAESAAIQYTDGWQSNIIPAAEYGGERDLNARTANQPGASIALRFNGESVAITYSMGPDHGVWLVSLDGQTVIDADTDQPLLIDAYNPTVRHDNDVNIQADNPGEHTLELTIAEQPNPKSQGAVMTLAAIQVLPKSRQNSLGIIIALILGVELIGLLFALTLGSRLFTAFAETFDTRRSILLALGMYAIVAIWGFFLNSTVEFWFLAWMVAVVQGGSQALSRSLYASLSPAAKSGEFFGLFGIMEKFSSIIGPLLFAAAGVIFGSSRPAVLSLILLFALGGFLLTRVNIDEGKRVAQLEDAEFFQNQSTVG